MVCNQYSLRPLQEKDASKMLEWMKDENVTRHLKINGANMALEDTVQFIKNARDESKNLHRAIVDAADCYLGTVSLKNIDHVVLQAEYAIAMHAAAFGAGAAAAGTDLILRTAFDELGLKRVYLNVLKENGRAVRFYDKMGFTHYEDTVIELNGIQKTLSWYEKRK